MPGFDVQVEGLAELKAKLDTLARPQAKRISNRALRAGGEVYKAAIEERIPERTNTPSGTALPPGALKHDIRIKTISAPEEDSSYVAVGPSKYTSRVMHWLEFGHRMVVGGYSRIGKNGKARGPGRAKAVDVPAHPVMRPAFEFANSAALEAVAASLRADLNKIDLGGS